MAISQTDKSHQSCEIYFINQLFALVYDRIYYVYIFLLLLGNILKYVYMSFPSSWAYYQAWKSSTLNICLFDSGYMTSFMLWISISFLICRLHSHGTFSSSSICILVCMIWDWPHICFGLGASQQFSMRWLHACMGANKPYCLLELVNVCCAHLCMRICVVAWCLDVVTIRYHPPCVLSNKMEKCALVDEHNIQSSRL